MHRMVFSVFENYKATDLLMNALQSLMGKGFLVFATIAKSLVI
jgi:hypothetical protein